MSSMSWPPTNSLPLSMLLNCGGCGVVDEVADVGMCCMAEGRIRFGKLRMTFSAVCGVLCLLLLALWVRSYWWTENVVGPSRGSFRLGVASANGWLTVRYGNGKLGPKVFPKGTLQSTSAEAMEEVYKQMEASIKGTNATFSRPKVRFGWKDDWGFQFPYWMPTALFGILAVAVGWKLPWQFSLRTLLIATTVVAAGLGALIWTLRRI